MAFLKAVWQQYFPSRPAFTEKDVPAGSQVGKVFIVTGGNQGVGFELVKMLYPSGATIYIAGRSKERVEKAIADITSQSPQPATPSTLRFIPLDLADLTTVKPAAALFASQEKRLDILWNNAGLAGAEGTSTNQGIEMSVGTNCVAPLLFTQELLPLLQAATRDAPAGSVRIIWSGSLMVDTHSPKGGVDFKNIDTGVTTALMRDYATSKVGNWFLSVEAAERWGKYGIVNVVQNPGNLNTNIYHDQPWILMAILRLVLYPPKFGGYTSLFSGFSKDVHGETNAVYVWPWGQVRRSPREDIHEAIKAGKPTEFWEWCEKKYSQYV